MGPVKMAQNSGLPRPKWWSSAWRTHAGQGHLSPAHSRHVRRHGRRWLAGASSAPAGAPQAPPRHGTHAATLKWKGAGVDGVSPWRGEKLTDVRRRL
jgi:hypothetical protein